MKKNVKNSFVIMAGLVFGLMSCASNKVASSGGKTFSDEKAVIELCDVQEITLTKDLKDELNAKSIHVEDVKNSSVPVAVYKLSLEKDFLYDFNLKSIPDGLMSFNMDKKTVMIPTVILYDENLNPVTNLYYSGKTFSPTNTEPLTFRVSTKWKIENSGSYYLFVKADMSSEQGITLTVWNYNNSTDLYFRRVPYGKFSFNVKRQ